jgi:hypothetical protein
MMPYLNDKVGQMSGENTRAKELEAQAISEAETSSSMSSDSMALAILSQALKLLSETISRKDLENYIDYDLDNMVESDMVITRGC